MLSARVRKFFSYYKPHGRLLAADIVCAVIAAAIALMLPLFARYITQMVLQAPSAAGMGHVYAVGALMLGLVLVQTACTLFVDYQGHMMGALMESQMRADLFDHYQKLSFAFYDDQKTGALMSRITNDLLSVSELYHHGPEEGMIALLKFAGAFVILLTIDVPLTLIIFLFLPLMGLWSLYFNRQMNAALHRSLERIADVNAQVEETLAGIRVVKSFANEGLERAKFARENARFVVSRRDGYRSEAYFSAGIGTFAELLTLAIIIFGAAAIANRALDAADLVAYLLFAGILMDPVRKFVNLARLYQEGITGFNRFMEIMELEPDIRDAPGAAALTHVEGRIEFREVSFRYRDEHMDILKDVSLVIQPGEYVALVGPSGVGKTTLCSLIPRFYDVSQGAVLLDGCDVRALELRSLREHIGVVQQDVYLFAGTVAENIAYGKQGASRAEIIAAARQANAHDFITALPDGYNTDIGQRGVRLSGGQKQRLSIARVFLKDPPVLIFDEATSALDNEAERVVQESLEMLARKRTTLVIAHRLTTIRNAHRIIVLTDQGVAEQGTHDALIAAGGVYAQLYNTQARL